MITRIWFKMVNVAFDIRVVLRNLFIKKVDTVQSGYKSLAWLGLLFKFNPWPIIVQLDNQGVCIHRRAWHGMWVKIELFPYKIIQTLSIQEYFGSFSKIKLLLKNTMTENESYEFKRFFKVNCSRRLAEEIFQHLGKS